MRRKRQHAGKDERAESGKVRRSGHLSPEDHDIWHHVTKSIEPLDLKDRIGPLDELEVPEPKARTKKSAAVPSPPRTILPPPTSPPTAIAKTSKPALAPFDARKAKRIARGRVAIDARIDLHGLRQDEARARLKRFLARAVDNDMSTVLVITGKGREAQDPYVSYAETLDRTPRGILRRNVPRWLEEPDIRPLVVSWTTAAVQHGGDGALYVHIRKRRPLNP